MNKFGGNTVYCFFLSIFISLSCQNPITSKKDFSYLIGKTKVNKTEIINLINAYLQAEEIKEIHAYEYLLENLEHQYRINFKLVKKDSVIPIQSSISIDSLLNLQKMGFTIDLIDTIKDIDVLKGEVLKNHVKNFVLNWKSKKYTSDLSFHSYMKAVLPYRVNNEPVDACFNQLNERYPIEKLIRLKEFKDTLDMYGKKISSIINEYSENLYEVNHLNTIDHKKIYSMEDKINDYEDFHIYSKSLLRHLGIPTFTQFTPHTKGGGTRSYTIKFLNRGFNLDSLNINNVGKVYISSFEKKDWNNPFDELIKRNIDIENIPISLYISKMKDVSDQVTKVKNLVITNYPMPNNATRDSLFYLCTYSSGTWMPFDFGILESGKIAFNNVGVNNVYILAKFSNGKLKIHSEPFIFSNDGNITYLNKGQPVSIKISMESPKKELQSGVKYTLYYFFLNEWIPITSLDSKTDTLRLYDRSLYTIRRNDEKYSKKSRPFSINLHNQDWW